MKRAHQAILKKKLPALLPKLKDLFAQEGLEDFVIGDLTLLSSAGPPISCGTGSEPCLVIKPDNSGFHWVCVAEGSC